MLTMVALLAVITAPADSAAKSGRIMLVGETIGGKAGDGGSAQNKTYLQCNVPGACPVYEKAQGGAGGAGGNANGNGSSNDKVVAHDLEPVGPASKISRCSLEIAGKMQIDANGCSYARTVSSNWNKLQGPSVNGKYSYTITWLVQGNGVAEASLSGGTTNNQRSLGLLHKDGACWTNSQVKLCAWK
jgi:hypothetical protein